MKDSLYRHRYYRHGDPKGVEIVGNRPDPDGETARISILAQNKSTTAEELEIWLEPKMLGKLADQILVALEEHAASKEEAASGSSVG